MTASAERIPSEYPETAVQIIWAHNGAASPMVQTEIKEAAADNFGQSEDGGTYRFPSLTHARAFCRRIEREIPEVTTELLR